MPKVVDWRTSLKAKRARHPWLNFLRPTCSANGNQQVVRCISEAQPQLNPCHCCTRIPHCIWELRFGDSHPIYGRLVDSALAEPIHYWIWDAAWFASLVIVPGTNHSLPQTTAVTSAASNPRAAAWDWVSVHAHIMLWLTLIDFENARSREEFRLLSVCISTADIGASWFQCQEGVPWV